MPNTLISNTSTRFQEATREVAFDRLSRNPEMQAEAIARHYVTHFNTARDLLELCTQRNHLRDTSQVDQAIAFLTEQIARNHEHAFGLPLAWPRRS